MAIRQIATKNPNKLNVPSSKKEIQFLRECNLARSGQAWAGRSLQRTDLRKRKIHGKHAFQRYDIKIHFHWCGGIQFSKTIYIITMQSLDLSCNSKLCAEAACIHPVSCVINYKRKSPLLYYLWKTSRITLRKTGACVPDNPMKIRMWFTADSGITRTIWGMNTGKPIRTKTKRAVKRLSCTYTIKAPLQSIITVVFRGRDTLMSISKTKAPNKFRQ